MPNEEIIMRIDCPVCGMRMCDKEEGAAGLLRQKCTRCKNVWRIDLKTHQFQLLSGKGIPRQSGA